MVKIRWYPNTYKGRREKKMENAYSLDFSYMPKELKLLLQIMQTDNHECIRGLNAELASEIDWGLFLQLAKHHRIYPLIYSKLSKIDEPLVPSRVIHILKQEYKENIFQMLKLSGEMERLSKLFAENNIRSLFMKGPAIADAIYGDISLRTSKDLDILIPKSDFEKVEEILLNLGYKIEEPPTIFKGFEWRERHVSYYHFQKGIEIEIHWRLYTPPAKEPSFDELWKRRRISKLTSYPVHFFGKEDLFFYLVAHGVEHGWFRLRWLADIVEVMRKEDFPLVPKDQSLLVGQALLLASQLFKMPIDEELVPLIAGKRMRKLANLAILYIIEEGNLTVNLSSKEALATYDVLHPFSIISEIKRAFVLNYYRCSMRIGIQKVIFIMLFLYPSSADFQTIKLPKPLYLLYFPLRPFLWIWRKTRKSTPLLKEIQKVEIK